MKKILGSVGLAIVLTLVSAKLSATECRNDFVEFGSDRYAEIDSAAQVECSDKEGFKGVFHIPPAVPLFLSAIAGLGVVALRGRTR